ncbi:uncharacterized protein [Venturia canescens]|uniref:uncharacterized protein n=1 Tax=Venturia canescens TaxID=32260 RepID=UPI001C9D4F32|nr:uncharacterized protein LOC122418361 [Venturia canescens]
MSDKMTSKVADFYRDKSVFITGGTGFLGICLIEKLLRCCPDIKNIYMLMRPKKGKEIAERLEEVISNSVFERLIEEKGRESFKKLIPIAGDVGQENLGLSSTDRLILVEHVHVVFHSAASLDFEASLKTAVDINLLGTRRVAQLSQEIRNLQALVHVSSAYVNSFLLDVKEQIYPAPMNVDELLKLVEETDEAALNAATPKIIKDHPNAYTFTKHLAEHEIVKANLRSAIVRPSMITGSWKEPLPGWTISKNGPQGFLMGASRGVVRRLPANKNVIYDYIPVDIVVNALLVSAYFVATETNASIKVYHLTSGTCNPFSWSGIDDKINSFLHKYPLCGAVWYPYLKLLPSIWMYRLSAFFVHMIPAYILDTITRLAGGRPILVRLHTNVNNSLDRLEKFIFTEWKFHNPRTLELHETLSNEDKRMFTVDVRPIVWKDYFIDLTKGVRVYLSKEPLKNLDKARSKDTMLMWVHLGFQAALFGFIWWIFKALLGSTWTNTGMVVPIAYLLFSQLCTKRNVLQRDLVSTKELSLRFSSVPRQPVSNSRIIMEPTSTISEWFRDKNILVTGSTGFMGKVLLAKLLTSCPDIGKIYLLVREKKGVDPKTRLNSIVQQEPFKEVRENCPERLKKLLVISGDTSTDGLGLSTLNNELLINVISVIFHMAANVKFDLPLKSAVNFNTRGTSNILVLAKQMKKLEAFIHVSTAYCNCHESVLEERAYPTEVSPESILSLVQTTSDDLLEKMTPDLIGKEPNTYAFSKVLSEDLVSRSGLPVGIARPSIVTASFKEPVPGWIENMNGPTGLMIGAGKGVIRTMLCNKELLADLIPCDLVINAIIALAWKVGNENSNKPIFMNVTESGRNPLTWENALETGKKHALANPFSGPLWYPGGSLTSNKFYHHLRVLLFHLLPAYFLDTILVLMAQKPFLVRIQTKVTAGLELLVYYTTKQWDFRNNCLLELEKQMSPEDRDTFFTDSRNIDWDEYMKMYILGTRKFCLKDDPSTLPQARKVFQYLRIADFFVKMVFIGSIAWFGYSWLSQLRIPTRQLVGVNEF